jgi:cell division protein FtsW
VKFATTVLIFCVAALLALGTVMLYSSPRGGSLLTQQVIWIALGILGCGAAAMFDYRHLKKISWALLALAVLALGAVWAPHIGLKVNGARRWLDLGWMNFQPSELAKLALIIVTAHYAEHFQRKMRTFWKGLILPGAFIVPVLGLIFLEPDYGTTILLAAVTGLMLVTAGSRLTFIAPAAVVGAVVIGIFIWHNPVRFERMMAFRYPEQHRDGKGFQQYQATIALGSGGTTGVGLGDGRQKYGYVPENHTDFILSIVGEELGMVATLSVIVAFMLIALCGIYIATHASDRFGMLLCAGIVFLISLQAIINIGVVTSSLPNKGLSLPFVSYGGSNLLMMLVGVGLLLSVARHAREPVRRERSLNPFNPQEIPSTQLS